ALIGSSIKITGDVVGDENLVIDGSVEGTINLSSNELVIGQSGHINANMSANIIRVDGEVKGDINGQEKVIVSKTGRVKGNIVAPRVTLEDGAKFKGSIDMDPGGLETSTTHMEKPGSSLTKTKGVNDILEKASSDTGG
ncbi:MAG TPA: polymer-forming cytoskeletal protein, partial [Porticoccaceae bacterium]|nr:polymer-forming cytoskeletal protein [Porticoccaceae bacterium]